MLWRSSAVTLAQATAVVNALLCPKTKRLGYNRDMNPAHETPATDGGLGAARSAADDAYPIRGRTKADRMEQRAVQQRWAIPEAARAAIVDRQVELATTGKPREATAAARALIAMEAQNQADERRLTGVHLVDPHDVAATLIAMQNSMERAPEPASLNVQ